MPHRLEHFYAALVYLTGMIATVLSAVVAILGDLGAQAAEMATQVGSEVAIYDDGKARVVCLIGAWAGAVLAVLFFAKGDTVRVQLGKLLAAMIASAVFTPWAIRWLGLVPTTDNLIATGTTCALVLPAVVQVIIPYGQTALAKLFKKRLDDVTGTDQQGDS